MTDAVDNAGVNILVHDKIT